ncbi:hypothetical protein B0T18DRAFT_135957 [Schizothecium vesticola]|uniref:Uncharacterized protein n=1 Tax=Schizothecium vesticola TaxID=314040 RepID=A0AA40EUG9_9PEZI|nr:hypothetical protein B0T18DRAFT_135957 [Schizothecium vesticola]
MVASSCLKMVLHAAFLIAAILPKSKADSLDPWLSAAVITETVWTTNCSVEEATTTPTGYTTTTSIVLANAVLTNVTLQPATSPTSCYELPTPIASLDVVAFAVSHISDTDIDPVLFYLADNATVPVYVATFVDGHRILLDVSSGSSTAGRVALAMPRGESIVFDATGIHHFDAPCDSVLSVDIGGFLEQITSIAFPSPGFQLVKSNLRVRNDAIIDTDADSVFSVTIQVDDAVGNQLMAPQLSFGPTACKLVKQQLGTEWSNFTWACDFPGANSSVKRCANAFASWLEPSFSQSGAQSSEQSEKEIPLFNVLPSFLDEARSPIIHLFPNLSQPLGDGLDWISKAHIAVLDAGAGGALAMCSALHQSDQYGLLFSDPGLSDTHTVGVYHSPPVSTIFGQVASRTTLMTREPPRVVIPTVSDFPSVTAASFPVPVLEAPTEMPVPEEEDTADDAFDDEGWY